MSVLPPPSTTILPSSIRPPSTPITPPPFKANQPYSIGNYVIIPRKFYDYYINLETQYLKLRNHIQNMSSMFEPPPPPK